MGAEVHGHRSAFLSDDATEAVLVMRDAISHGKLFDRWLRLDIEGAAGQVSPLGGGSCLHQFQYAPYDRADWRSGPPS